MDATLTLEPPMLAATATVSRRGRVQRVFAVLASGGEWVFGAASLFVGLSVLAALPAVQFLSLGYLLEASGRVARSGRIRDGWIGVRRAGRVGGLVAGAWLSLLSVRLVSSLATSAELIDPDGPIARAWRGGLLVLTALTALHVAASCARGGRLRHFAWPPANLIMLARRVRRGGLYAESRDATWDFVAALPLYLLKIEIVPREAAWLPGLLFVGFLFPARLASGWAYAQGDRRASRRHWALSGLGRLGMVPVAAAYVLIVFLAQYTSWGGLWSLYEQHAFLLPVPFLGS